MILEKNILVIFKEKFCEFYIYFKIEYKYNFYVLLDFINFINRDSANLKHTVSYLNFLLIYNNVN